MIRHINICIKVINHAKNGSASVNTYSDWKIEIVIAVVDCTFAIFSMNFHLYKY